MTYRWRSLQTPNNTKIQTTNHSHKSIQIMQIQPYNIKSNNFKEEQ